MKLTSSTIIGGRRLSAFATLLFASAVSLSASDYYKFTSVKKLDNNLYGGRSGFNNYLIETSMCLHLTIGEEVVLKWDGYSGTIVWEDNSTCQVKGIARR